MRNQAASANIFGWCGVVRLVWLKRVPIDNTPVLLKGVNVNDDLSATQVKKMFEGKDQLKPNPHFQTLNDLRLAWAVLSVQMEVWAVRRSPFSVPPDDKIDNSFAQRAVVDEIYP